VLHLHRMLVEIERRDYERAHGRLSPAALLHNLIHDATFAWLRPLTALIAQMDELMDDPLEEAPMEASVGELRKLLRPFAEGSDFQRRYAALLQQEPDLVVAHGSLIRIISP
jgi:hypothetical protein